MPVSGLCLKPATTNVRVVGGVNIKNYTNTLQYIIYISLYIQYIVEGELHPTTSPILWWDLQTQSNS